uniref:Uncharacterized protein n=1 Tax=Oryza barthii TaxID=65489 RepID=A0A0D3GWY4_9ORYZ
MASAAAAVAAKAWWTAAMSVGAVEGLKDQSGLCRWNYALRSLHGAAMDTLMLQVHGGAGASSPAAAGGTSSRSTPSTARSASASSPAAAMAAERPEEEGMRRVMYLSCCWGPS